jgi:hypothetical protein
MLIFTNVQSLDCKLHKFIVIYISLNSFHKNSFLYKNNKKKNYFIYSKNVWE